MENTKSLGILNSFDQKIMYSESMTEVYLKNINTIFDSIVQYFQNQKSANIEYILMIL